MSSNLTDIVANARRHFEAGDFATARRLLDEALHSRTQTKELAPREEQARAEARQLVAAMRLDPVAIAGFVLTAAVLVILLLLYGR